MAVISGFSTALFSAENTGHVFLPVLRWLLPGAQPASLDLLHTAIRKSAHLFEYGVLALLWYRALAGIGKRWHLRAAAIVLLIAVGFACVDEFHQIFVPGRTPAITDVGWDGTGAALSLAARFAISGI
jgi:VanZ family protein